jgi:hypothetical protein
MRKRRQPLRPWLPKKAERGFHGYPIATIAFYGPTDKLATKVADGIIGCPHEEGVDYPEGKYCPQCPYWAGRDRWTKERTH